MQRVIKFRFFDKTLKSMGHRRPNTYDFDHEEIIPMQYTGMKDCKGKEIYEGDIIGDLTEEDKKMEQSKLTVYFDERLGEWMLDCSKDQDQSLSYALFKELEDFKYEVIGNIYEHAGLLHRAVGV